MADDDEARGEPYGYDTRAWKRSGAEAYVGRPGYRADFLGTGRFRVPMPTASDALESALATTIDGGTRLDYTTYSVWLHRERRLPALCAANFDSRTVDRRVERSESWWKAEPRLASEQGAAARQQVTDTFYDAQPRVRNKKVFHRGHLVAFENARWGDEPLQAGVDSFHFTNCAPQWGEFNATDLWRNLEAWATSQSAATGRSQKATMFSGCVFDAPLSSKPRPDELALEADPEGAAERWRLNLDGAAHPDLELADPLGEGVEGTVRVPKQFFKVLVWRQAGRLTVEAFILTQEGWLAALAPRRALREAAPELPSHLLVYQVDLRDIERLTGLDFGLSPRGLTDMAHRPPRLITSVEEIRP